MLCRITLVRLPARIVVVTRHVALGIDQLNQEVFYNRRNLSLELFADYCNGHAVS
jgi:hypothetical protein